MEALGACSDTLAAQWAMGLAVVTGLIGLVVFAFSRTIVSLLYGALSAMLVYIAGLLLLPHAIVAFVVATFGAGWAICQ